MRQIENSMPSNSSGDSGWHYQSSAKTVKRFYFTGQKPYKKKERGQIGKGNFSDCFSVLDALKKESLWNRFSVDAALFAHYLFGQPCQLSEETVHGDRNSNYCIYSGYDI